MFEAKKLREERAVVVKQMHDLAATIKKENREFTADEFSKWDQLEADEKSFTSRIETADRLERSPKEDKKLDLRSSITSAINHLSNPRFSQEEQNLALRAWCFARLGRDELITDDMRDITERSGLSGNRDTLTCEFRAQSTDATAGGNTLNDSLAVGVEKVLKDFGGMFEAGKVYPTDDGASRHWAIYDDTATVGAIIAENEDSTNTSVTFSKKSIPVFTYRTAVYPISLELLQDSAAPIMQIVSDVVGERLARGVNAHLTDGDATGEPEGVVTASALGHTLDGTAATAVIEYADLVTLQHSVDPLYRRNAVWMFNDNTLSKLKLMIDENLRPLWLPSMSVSEPSTILGHRYIVNNDMDSIGTTSKKIMLFGDFSRYVIRRARNVEIMTLRERYAEKLAVGIIGFGRFGGGLLTNKAVKHLITPAA